MADLMMEVALFQKWADTYPPDTRSGEWECDYESWATLYAAVDEFLARRAFETWTLPERRAILFAIARDNEMQVLAKGIGEAQRHLLVPLAQAALEIGERDNRWQLAEELGRTGRGGGAEEEILRLLVEDTHEYVRRKALEALTRIGSPAVERYALRAWHLPDPDQQWARMMSLWCLRKIGSTHLDLLLAEGARDPREYLRGYAERMRRGQVRD